MAEIEAEMDMRASYFLLLGSPYYNLLSDTSIAAPRRLVALGHEVGLHYDVRSIARASEEPAAVLAKQAELLSELAGEKVVSIAMHNPSTSGADLFRRSAFINAYDEKFTQDGYFSDSCGAWRDDFVNRYAEDKLPENIQLLVHPIFWAEESQDRLTTLEQFAASQVAELADEIEGVRELWSQHSGVQEHDQREARQAAQ